MNAAFKIDAIDLEAYKNSKKIINADVKSLNQNKDKATDDGKSISVIKVCGHFESHLLNVNNALNEVTITCNAAAAKKEVPNDVIDMVYNYFDELEDYVEFICQDFQHFSETVKKLRPNQSALSGQTGIRLNLVSTLFEYLEHNVARQKAAILGMLLDKLTPEQLEQRAV